MVKVYKQAFIERDGEEFELEVEADVSPFIPATGPSYYSGGEPAEGGEVEIERITHNGVDIQLTDEELGAVAVYIAENLVGDEFDDYPEGDY